MNSSFKQGDQIKTALAQVETVARMLGGECEMAKWGDGDSGLLLSLLSGQEQVTGGDCTCWSSRLSEALKF
jgi:hypothetical protein